MNLPMYQSVLSDDEALLREAQYALDYAADMTEPNDLNGCDCPICTVGKKLEKRLENGMILPTLPDPDCGVHYTEAQMRQLQADTIDAVLRAAWEKSKLFGNTGEVMWISIKGAVRHEQKRIEK